MKFNVAVQVCMNANVYGCCGRSRLRVLQYMSIRCLVIGDAPTISLAGSIP